MSMQIVKIFGTLGPACHETKMIEEMFQMGMSGMRLNLSHVDLEDCKDWIHHFRLAAQNCGIKPELLIDMKGPELRLSRNLNPVLLKEHDIVSAKVLGLPEIIFPYLKDGQEILLDDGNIQLVYHDLNHLEVVCGGLLKPAKSVAVKGCEIPTPTLTDADYKNLSVAKDYGVTGIMQPFVRDCQDLKTVRKALDDNGLDDCKIYAKIENKTGVAQLESLLPYCDEIIVARGDLANSVGIENIASCQHHIETFLHQKNFPYMIVTQMLNSMIDNPIPTRAEISDIYHAVYNGAKSIMLTAETAAGKYPLQAMKVFTSVANTALKDMEC